MTNKLEALRLEAETLSGLMVQLAENEIDSDSFAVMSDLGENGQEHECDLPITETALRASSIIDQLVAALEEKDARATACVNAFEGIETDRIAGKTLGEFLAGEVRLNKAEPKPDGSYGFTFSGFAIQMMAEAFAEQFKDAGAVNYLELLFQHDELGPLTVTMQRVEGLTPAQKLAAAEQRAEAAEKQAKKQGLYACELFDEVKRLQKAPTLSAGARQYIHNYTDGAEADCREYDPDTGMFGNDALADEIENYRAWLVESPNYLSSHATLVAYSIADVLEERARQISAKGYDPEHDDTHVNDEIAALAAWYVMPPAARDWNTTSTGYGDTLGEAILPGWNQPGQKDRRRELVIGAALTLAEIERLDRAAAKVEGE
jgi:hypothetical protein